MHVTQFPSQCTQHPARITSYCDDLVEGLSSNSQLTWSSDDSVSESGCMICMSEDPDENHALENEDDDASGVDVVAVLGSMAGGCVLLGSIAVICEWHKSRAPAPVTSVVVHATAVTVDPTCVELQPEPEDDPDAELPPADDYRPGSGEEVNPDAELHRRLLLLRLPTRDILLFSVSLHRGC